MQNCSEISKSIISGISNSGFANAFDEITKMVKGGTGLMVHSANVSSLSVLFAMTIGHCTPSDLEDLAMGGLLHDLGLSMSSESVVKKYLANE